MKKTLFADIIEYFEETEIEGQSLAILILDSCDLDHLKELKLVHKPISLWCSVTCCTNETFFVACIEDLEHCEAEVEITYLSSWWS